MVMMAVVGTLAFNFSTVLPLFSTRALGGDDSTFTLLLSLVSVGALAGAIVAARRASTTVRTVGWSSVSFGAALAVLAVMPGLGAALPAGVAVGLTSVLFLTSSTAIVQLEARPEMRGRVLALQAMLFLGSTPIGGPIVGWVAEEAGSRVAVLVGAVATLAAGAWGLSMAGRTGRNPTRSDGMLGDGAHAEAPVGAPAVS
jgi:predicted MFS family arabinose efflux permease